MHKTADIPVAEIAFRFGIARSTLYRAVLELLRETVYISFHNPVILNGGRAKMNILLKRAYEEPDSSDGFRVLVDRLWPRGKKKADLRLDAWAKDISPSTELRKWFDHDPKHWLEFCKRYKAELSAPEMKN